MLFLITNIKIIKKSPVLYKSALYYSPSKSKHFGLRMFCLRNCVVSCYVIIVYKPLSVNLSDLLNKFSAPMDASCFCLGTDSNDIDNDDEKKIKNYGTVGLSAVKTKLYVPTQGRSSHFN